MTLPIRFGAQGYNHYGLFTVHPNDGDPIVVRPFGMHQIGFTVVDTNIIKNKNRDLENK